MTDDNPQSQEPRSSFPASGGLGPFQFSLLSMFVVMTVIAVILSAFFSVGRLLGMSNVEVLTHGLGRFLFAVPTFLVWIVGLTMAIRRLKQNRLPAILTMIALGGMVLTEFVLQLVQMALIHSVNYGRISQEAFSWSFFCIDGLYAVLDTACWILILAAIFRRRPPDAPETERTGPTSTDDLTLG
ncbi:MAG: hypothetical protein ABSG68_00455 [Thermoguttaceae bacterium]|jgi:hypothetical protein